MLTIIQYYFIRAVSVLIHFVYDNRGGSGQLNSITAVKWSVATTLNQGYTAGSI